MPRYYFDTIDGDRDRDTTGAELPGDGDAVHEAVRYAGALIGDQPSLLDEAPELVVTVRSDEKVVAEVKIEVVRHG